MSDLLHDHICSNGFEASLQQLVNYAETQARLHQAFGDRPQWLFWVRAWARLQKASEAIAFPVNDEECLNMWWNHSQENIGAESFNPRKNYPFE